MTQEHIQTAIEPDESESKEEWVCPKVTKLDAGSAESGDFASPDGQIGFS